MKRGLEEKQDRRWEVEGKKAWLGIILGIWA